MFCVFSLEYFHRSVERRDTGVRFGIGNFRFRLQQFTGSTENDCLCLFVCLYRV